MRADAAPAEASLLPPSVAQLATVIGWPGDARRAMMQRQAGVDSSTALDADGARKVLNHLRKSSKTAPRDNPWAWVNDAAEDKRPVLWKIRRITINLGIAPEQQIAYAEGVAARIAGHERHLRMMTSGELWKLIGPLERTARYKAAGAPAEK